MGTCRNGYPRRPYTPRSDEPMDGERAEAIDARFDAALAHIKASRPFAVDATQRRTCTSAEEHSLSVHSRFQRTLRG